MDVYEAFIEKDGRRGRKYRFYKPGLEQIDAPRRTLRSGLDNTSILERYPTCNLVPGLT